MTHINFFITKFSRPSQARVIRDGRGRSLQSFIDGWRTHVTSVERFLLPGRDERLFKQALAPIGLACYDLGL